MPTTEPLLHGRSPAMLRTLDLCTRLAKGHQPLLLVGQRGTGKTELARHIHRISGRRGGLVEVSLASQPEGLELSALQGHEDDAFTGAKRSRKGLVETAQSGSCFLDEIEATSLATQAFLLKLLETRTIRRLGEARPVEVDVRFIAATNADLPGLISEGSFRQDLRDRFGYFVIEVPSLAQRSDEVIPLARHFLQAESRNPGSPPLEMAPEVLEVLMTAPWPGNIRELRSLCEFLAAMCEGKPWIELTDLPADFIATLPKPAPLACSPEIVRQALDAAGGHRETAARNLDISPRHLYRLLNRYKNAQASG